MRPGKSHIGFVRRESVRKKRKCIGIPFFHKRFDLDAAVFPCTPLAKVDTSSPVQHVVHQPEISGGYLEPFEATHEIRGHSTVGWHHGWRVRRVRPSGSSVPNARSIPEGIITSIPQSLHLSLKIVFSSAAPGRKTQHRRRSIEFSQLSAGAETGLHHYIFLPDTALLVYRSGWPGMSTADVKHRHEKLHHVQNHLVVF